MHHLSMIGAVVVHDHQDGDLMVCRGPEHAGRVHQIAIALDRDGNDTFVAISESRADRPRGSVAFAGSAGTTEKVVIFGRRPQAPIPLHAGRSETPFFVLDCVPQMCAHPSCTDRGRLPAIGGGSAYSFFHPTVVRA